MSTESQEAAGWTLPQLKASRTGSAQAPGHRANKERGTTADSAGKEGFAQKLLHRIKGIEERLEDVEKHKLDAQIFERQKSMVERREQGLTEEVKQMKVEFNALRDNTNAAHAALQLKADGASLDRLADMHEDTRSSMRAKADADLVSSLQEGMSALENAVGQLDTQLQSKVEVAPMLELQAQMSKLAHSLRMKAEEDRMRDLHERTVQIQRDLEELDLMVRQKADAVVLQSAQQDIQEITSSLRDKGDANSVRTHQAHLVEMNTQIELLQEKFGQSTPLQVFSGLQDAVYKMGAAQKLKADSLDVSQMQSQLQSVHANLEQLAHQLDSVDKWQAAASEQLTTLRQDAIDLRADIQEQNSALQALGEDF
mmetsp:Transcript_32752/g.59864  ORF Transcript_32752/g.59864 Transcript_32752/m.59864 type:complete len:369 (-) Transcript_32752:77-1183(-)